VFPTRVGIIPLHHNHSVESQRILTYEYNNGVSAVTVGAA